MNKRSGREERTMVMNAQTMQVLTIFAVGVLRQLELRTTMDHQFGSADRATSNADKNGVRRTHLRLAHDAEGKEPPQVA
jgi:hypothetical protein